MAPIEGNSYRDTRVRQPLPAASASPETYRVAPGETAREIAVRHRVPADRIAAANPHVDDLRSLGGGESLEIPGPAADAPEPLVYTAAPGESLAEIAERHGTTEQALEQANGLAADEQVAGGEQLLIPADAGSPTAPIPRHGGDTRSIDDALAAYASVQEQLAPVGGSPFAVQAVPADPETTARKAAFEVRLDPDIGALRSTAPGADAPPSEVSYESASRGDNSVTWTVDAEGRPVYAEATLGEVFADLPRSSAETTAQGDARERGVDGDAGGHVVGHRFVGDQGLRNLFPQDSQFNNSAYRTLENEWADWTRNGMEVRLEVSLSPQGQDRPDEVAVSYEVVDPDSGEVIYDNNVLFQNESGQTFDRIRYDDMPRYYG